MITLGVDLASSPSSTAWCRVEWEHNRAVVLEVVLGATDDDLLAAFARSQVAGIDCPFGWPLPFAALLAARPGWVPPAWTDGWRDELRFRLTDHEVRRHTGRWPLSVSSDRIGVVAFRCRGLLARMGVGDRSGDGRVFEVYPAASLRQWRLPASGYKRAGTAPPSVEELCRSARWLDLGGHGPLLGGSADAFDALVAALAARAAALGLTPRPGPDERARVAREGWIALPPEGSLDRLLAEGVRGDTDQLRRG